MEDTVQDCRLWIELFTFLSIAFIAFNSVKLVITFTKTKDGISTVQDSLLLELKERRSRDGRRGRSPCE